ncbi:MAG: DUF6478 family protein [Planktotalea sp.]|uniref:DUF6478 family protein n=1 Tax=Planktotalea sp. TaxID=2029877 RepID=UPI003C71FE7E
MAAEQPSLLNRILFKRTLRRWAKIADGAAKTPISTLRKQRSNALRMLVHLNRFVHIADNRLALPLIGSQAIQKSHDSDWAWRPEAWTGPLPVQGMASVPTKSMLGSEISLHHDCELSELSLRQLRNTREADLAPYGLRMDVFKFDGSFLSLVIDFPEASVVGLRRKHLIRLEPIIEMEKPLEIFARLNIKHGPNTEQVVRELPLHDSVPLVEFDLAYTKLNEKRVDSMWLDLIFEGPQMNQVTLRDLTLSRRPRADV